MPAKYIDVPMDNDALKETGYRLGTGAIMIFDQNTCLVGATLNLITYFARESCGFCTPCREGLPYIKDLLAASGGRGGHRGIYPQAEADGQIHGLCLLRFCSGRGRTGFGSPE